ncbi:MULTISPECIES: carbohydrate ABC transporter permease [Caproicibacterium]|uniref:Carbohydrate ABC transporter permease n=1 Tax=Caproicibacterium argilliputei TaxID=3030016 RepID=A0AA97H1J6_9FIRM|nr:carbohydrate ABC transporter permease [Caproicibacterium argilliputei]WOC31382.1 carbohydrate ABC transporter permease [Caproicibacterium argilliputei]
MKKNQMTAKHTLSAHNGPDAAFQIVVVAVAVLSFIMVVYPMYFIVIASFSDSTLVNQGQVILLPKGVSLYGYQHIFDNAQIWTGYKNTIFYSVVGTALNMAVTLPAAYVLSRKAFRPRRIIMALFVFTMYFNGGMVPTYMLVKNLGLLNTPWILIVMGALNVFNLIITRTFFENSIPEDLYEAATLDGCSHFRYFSTIVLPLSKAVIAVIMLYYLVGHWNDFFNPLLYINKDSLQPLQIILRNILLSNQAMAGSSGGGASGYAQQFADQIKFGVIIVSTLPVLCVYPFIQKYFEKGVMIGAVKG